MAFLRHPLAKEREAKNAAALQAAGLDPTGVEFFGGQLVWQGDQGYAADRQMSNPAFQAYPALIAYCSSPMDAMWCLEKSTLWGYPPVCRSGGHSTAGYCVLDGRLVIDMSRVDFAIVSDDRTYAMVGPGITFGNLNDFLSAQGLHVPGGGCPDVRVGGYTQGGGYGFTSRQFGMNCDNVLWFSMVLANGGLVAASPNVNGDLYWAVRGGTGNNFGVLTSVRYKLHPLRGLWGAWLNWPLDTSQGVVNATNALCTLQQSYMNSSGSDSRFGYMVLISTQGVNQQPVMMLRVAFNGSEADLDTLLAPLIGNGGATPPNFPNKQYGTYAAINRDLLAAPYEIPSFPPLPPGQMWAEDKQSGYVERQLQQSDWNQILNYYLQGLGTQPYTTIVIEPYGGAINQVSIGDCAFIHRNVAMDIFVDVFWNTARAGKEKQPAVNYLNGFMSLIANYSNGKQYQNYPRRSTVQYQRAYWDRAYPTLVKVKTKYDPNNVFNFGQSIGYDPLGIQPMPTKADPWLPQPITYLVPPTSASKGLGGGQ